MKRLLPQRLTLRIVLLIILTLIATQISFSWVVNRMQDQVFQKTMRRNASVMGTNIAHGASHHLEENEKKELDDLLRQSLELPNIWRILITDPDGRVLVAMERRSNGEKVYIRHTAPLSLPGTLKQTITDSPTDLILWEPIVGSKTVGWLQATYTLQNVQQIKAVTWRKSLQLACVWILLGTAFVILALRRPLASLARLSEFAHTLPSHQGDQVDIPGGAIEIRHLADALNTASRELKARGIQVNEERQHLKIALDELKRTEAKGRQQQEFLTTIVESLTHPFYVINAKTYEIVLANSAARQGDVTPGATCHGVTHQSALPCNDVSHPCPLELVKKTRQAVMVEHVHEDQKGTKRIYEVHGYPIFDEEGEVVQMLEYSLDITERKKAQDEVRRNDMRLAALFRISQSRSESLDQLLNLALEEALTLTGSRIGFMFRYDEERRELKLSSWSKGVMEKCEVEGLNLCSQLDDAGLWGEPVRVRAPVILNDYRQPHPDKKGLPAGHAPLQNFLGVPVFNGERIVALLGVANRSGDYGPKDAEQLTLLMDSVWKIVERMSADAALERLNEELEERVGQRTSQLEEANRELESFCYSVSHDLRAPLRHIDGYGSILEEDYAERIGEAGGLYLKKMRQATDRMGQLIDALLQLSRIGRSALQASRVDFSRMVADVLDELQASQPDRQVELRIEEGVEVMADPHLMRVVADNLLGNAWKYTSTRETAVISFGRTVRDGKSCLFVGDNGVGFDMAYADKLFGPFQRLHGLDEFEGSGVGLATVQRIINRHGGTIWAEAAVDEGATFYFTLLSVS